MEFERGNATNPSDSERIPSIKETNHAEIKRCTHRILYSLDLQGMEALMVYLFTEVGRALMSISNKT